MLHLLKLKTKKKLERNFLSACQSLGGRGVLKWHFQAHWPWYCEIFAMPTMKGNPQALWTEVVLESQKEEILKKIQFTSFSIRLRLMLAWKFMKINTYNIRQILQPSLYWQKQWRHHLFSEAAETVAIDFFLFWNTIPSSSPPLLRCRNQKETTGCVVVHPKSMDKAQQSIAAFVNGCRKSVSNTSLIFPRIMKQGKEQW